jgi:tripartite-type tricarboxylate transporter receptor subunit TctC
MKFFVACFLSLFSIMAVAKDYVLIVPNTPGSVSDILARKISEMYNAKTGHKLVVQNVPGGNQITAAAKFDSISTPAILMTTTGILVFNPEMQKNLPYRLENLDHVGGIGLATQVWVVRAESPYKTMKDLEGLPSSAKPLIAYPNLVEYSNVVLLSRKFGWQQGKVDAVKYRGVPEVVQGLLSGDLDVAVVSITSAVIAQINNGRLRALGTTIDQSLKLDTVIINPVSQQLGVQQFTGGTFLSLNKFFNKDEAEELKQNLYKVLDDPVFEKELDKLQQVKFRNNNNNKVMNDFINNFRSVVSTLNLSVQ